MSAVVASLMMACAVFAAEPAITVTVESESRFVFEPFTLRVDVVSEEDPARPVVPDGSGYTVSSISAGQRLSYNRNDTTTFVIEIVASQAGVITVAPVEVQSGETKLKSAPLRLVVDEPRPAEGVALSVDFTTTNLYVNQAVEMTVRWRSRTPFIQYQELVFDLPVLRSAALSVFPLEPEVPEKQRMGLPVNEQRVIAEKFQDQEGEGLCFRFMVVPLEAGVFGSGGMHLACALMKDKQNSNQYPSYFNNNFFSVPGAGSRFERVYATAPVARLHVAALPEQGRSPLFCGVAGNMSVRAAVNPREVVVGDPMMFEIELGDMSFGGQVTELPAVALAGIGPSFRLTPDPIKESTTPDGRRFVYALRALRCDVSFIPAIALQVFDPDKGSYRTLRTKPVPVKVNPDEGREIYIPADTGNNDFMVPLNGIRGNKKESVALMNVYEFLGFIGAKAWLFWLLAPIVWFCLRGWIRHLERCRTDAAYARAARAMRVFRRNLGGDEEMALREYLADRFGLCAAAITAESCAGELRNRGVPEETVAMVKEYFRATDSKKYSPSGEGATSRGQVARIARAVENGSRILAVLCLLFCFSAGASAPEESFSRAMEMQAERPDEARPLFVEAALGFEQQGAFFNAGNSWFFAGESGHALAAYLAAESRAPFNREIGDSIAFIRVQRSDGFEVKEGVTTGITGLWRRICRWDARLRLGFLTLLYLLAWYLYILYRVYGWRPGRRVCLVYALVMAFTALTLLASCLYPARGVVLRSADARLGPGYAYEAAYESVVSPAVEFEWLGSEREWVQARLPDGNTAWLHNSACVKVR